MYFNTQKNLESLKLSNLFRVIIFIGFGFMAINCGEDNIAQERTTVNQDRTAVNTTQRKDVIPVQDRTDVNPAQENPEGDDFVLRNIDIPEDYKPVKLARTVETRQPILRNRTASYSQPRETRTPSYSQPRETQTLAYDQDYEDVILTIPKGDFKGLKISSTKLANELNKYDNFYETRIYDFSFDQQETLWRQLRFFLQTFAVSFSVEKIEGVFEYKCSGTVVRPLFNLERDGITKIEKRTFLFRIIDCNDKYIWPARMYSVTMQDIVVDPEQFESLKASLDLS